MKAKSIERAAPSRLPGSIPGQPLERRTALVTGGARGIGRAIALALARQGAFVFVNFRHAREAAAECVDLIKQAGGMAEAIRGDVTRPRDVSRMFAWLARRAPRLDILVNNAGIAPPAPALSRVSIATWRRTLDTNLTGAFLCMRSAAPLMRRQRFGRIICVGSLAALRGGTIGPHYAASKAALLGLMQWSFRELAPFEVTVNVVAPGFVETSLSGHAYRTADARARMAAQVPLGRIGTAEEIAALVAFLAGPDSGYITGECITIAGGR